MIYLIADEHYAHKNIIKYDNRPFKDLEEMRETMIARHNEIIRPEDTVYHIGDFYFGKDVHKAEWIISRLNGKNIFIKGNHDDWLPENHPTRLEFWHGKQYIVLDHFQMTTWPKSHNGSFQFYGHSHGKSVPRGNQLEVFCGNYNYAPVLLNDLIKKIKND
jgi:calcineurin-like phosphoesterase family protein